MRKKVLIDLSKLTNLNCGLGRIAYSFVIELEEFNDSEIKFVFLLNGQAKRMLKTDFETAKVSVIKKYFPFFCKKYDLWHALHQSSHYMPKNKKDLYILTIHNLVFLYDKPKYEAVKRLEKLQDKINRADALVFISKYIEEEVQKYFKIPDIPTKVIYNGVEGYLGVQVQKPNFLPEGKFLFAISEITAKKNFAVLIDFIKKIPDYNLIIAGQKSSLYAKEMEAKIKELNLSNRVIMPGLISEDEKYFLYQKCDAFLFPSLLEGFGLPIIEAMRFGKPVFLSENSCLPEIGDKYAYYWEHFEPEYMRDFFDEKMEHFETNRYLKKEIMTYAETFSWKRNVYEYISLYKTLLKIDCKI